MTVDPFQVDFLLIDNFSMISFASAVEPFRIANKLLGEQRFAYRCVSIDGEAVAASNGFPMPVTGTLAGLQTSDRLVICSSDEVESLDLPDELGTNLRRLERHGTPLIAICTGAYILAKFGLLRGRACTIHWEYTEIFRETFPDADLQTTVAVEDGNLLTCSGGTAPLDLMIRLIRQVAGDQVSRSVADIAIHHVMRDETVHQRLDVRNRLNVSNPKFLQCVQLMEANIEHPLELEELCTRLGISLRQLQRLFKRYGDAGPRTFYEGIRLDRARQMLRRTAMEIGEIAVACGFPSTQTFSGAYKRVYLVTPTADRAS